MVNTFFIVISERGFNAFAENTKPVHVLIPASAQWRYLATRKLENDDWNQPSFDDSNWSLGKSGFGYGDDDDRTKLDSMRGEYDKLMIRKKFEVNDLSVANNLYLYIRFDDAFIAYLNGHEIARSGVLRELFVDKVDSHEANDYELFTINKPLDFIREGENVLAVAGFNRSLDSSDFSIEPILATVEVENPELPLELSKQEWYSDLDYLQARLEDQSSYLLLEKFDHNKVIQQLKNSNNQAISGIEFARILEKLIAQIGDAHAGAEVHLEADDDQYLPIILADTSKGIVALNADQTDFIEPKYPLLISIDGLPIEKWLEIAASYAPQASKQLIRYQSLKQLRSIDRMRTELGLPIRTSVTVTLQSIDSLQHKTLTLKSSNQRLSSVNLDLGESAVLDGNIGYLRISSMFDSADEAVESMALFKDTDGLIIDVRGNRGGRYEILQALYGYFIPGTAPPYVSNIAAYRLTPTFDTDHLHYRPTYRLSYEGWSQTEKDSIQEAMSRFRPQWNVPTDKFSEWHFMVLGKHPDLNQLYYQKPVAVLCDAASFSATDGFLSAFSDLPKAILIGQPSGGGSGATQDFRLPNSGIEIALSSMVSFRPNGKLYDGNGIEVDIELLPEPLDFLGNSDAVLEKALIWIGENL